MALPCPSDNHSPVGNLAVFNRLGGGTVWTMGHFTLGLHVHLNKPIITSGSLPITRLRHNMKNRLMPLTDRLLLHKRAIIESVFDQLKTISQIKHSRHRSPVNCWVNIVCGLIQSKKPSIAPEHHLLPAASPELTFFMINQELCLESSLGNPG